MMPYEKIRAWDRSHALALSVYRATQSWPPEERFGITAQARRAAFSVAANIAEGAGKKWGLEFQRFLNIALGSLSELSYALRLAEDLGLASKSQFAELKEQLQEAGKPLWRLYEVHRKRGKSGSPKP